MKNAQINNEGMEKMLVQLVGAVMKVEYLLKCLINNLYFNCFKCILRVCLRQMLLEPFLPCPPCLPCCASLSFGRKKTFYRGCRAAASRARGTPLHVSPLVVPSPATAEPSDFMPVLRVETNTSCRVCAVSHNNSQP